MQPARTPSSVQLCISLPRLLLMGTSLISLMQVMQSRQLPMMLLQLRHKPAPSIRPLRVCNRQQMLLRQRQMGVIRGRDKGRIKTRGRGKDRTRIRGKGRGKDRDRGKVKDRVERAMGAQVETLEPDINREKMSRFLCRGKRVRVPVHRRLVETMPLPHQVVPF